MREIKFRAWDKENKEFIYFTLNELIERRLTEVNNLSSVLLKFLNANKQQYTGLKDKNDIEIYEGDILGGWQNKEVFCQVLFGEYDNEQAFENSISGYGWYVKYLGGWVESMLDLYCSFIDRKMECEISGNIYKNPELIKEI